MDRININVSSTNYDKSSKAITDLLAGLEEMVHGTDGFVVTDSEFAFGWHFYVVSIRRDLVEKLAGQSGPDFQRLKGRGIEKKFLSWMSEKMPQKEFKTKFVIKEEMESSKYGIF